MTQQEKVIIDNKEYLKSELSEQANIQINNLQATEQEIARQEGLLAMLKSARITYANLLGEAIKATKPAAPNAAKKAAPKKAVNNTATKAAPKKAAAKTTTKTTAKKS